MRKTTFFYILLTLLLIIAGFALGRRGPTVAGALLLFLPVFAWQRRGGAVVCFLLAAVAAALLPGVSRIIRLPAIVSDRGGPPDIVRPHGSGLIVTDRHETGAARPSPTTRSGGPTAGTRAASRTSRSPPSRPG